MILRKLRTAGLIPNHPAPPLQSRNVRIHWATWHLASVFGFGFAALLFLLARGDLAPHPSVINALVLVFAVGAGLVLVATRGRHPGWIGLLAVAVLAHWGRSTRDLLSGNRAERRHEESRPKTR